MTLERGIRRIILAGSLAAAGVAGWLAYVDLTPAVAPPAQFCADLAAARKVPRSFDPLTSTDPALRAEWKASPEGSDREHDTALLAQYYEQHHDYKKFDSAGRPVPLQSATEAEINQDNPGHSAAMNLYYWQWLQKHPAYLDAHDEAQLDINAWWGTRDACSWVRRTMKIIGWSLGAVATVWAAFFFFRWIVMGFRGAGR